MSWYRRLLNLTRSERLSREIEREMEFHLAERVDELKAEGKSEAEAEAEARRSFGNPVVQRERTREADVHAWVESLGADLRFALRTHRRSPGFAAVAVLTLAIGIGATTAIFSVLKAVVLEPLPYPDPDRLVWVWETTPEGEDFTASAANYLDFRDRSRSFAHLGAAVMREVTLLGDGEPAPLVAARATPSYLDALGVAPALGRSILPAEASAGEPVAVLSDGLWRSRYGADPALVGRTIDLKQGAHVVVGVMPPGFVAPGDPELWLPLEPHAHAGREDHELQLIGRLAPGATMESAAADLRAVARRLGDAYPESNGGWSARLLPLRDRIVGGEVTRTMWILMGAVGLLLLVMCANLASLLLARGAGRRREMALRTALGAGRGRIVRQLLTESLLLSIAGTAVGLLIALQGVPLLLRFIPPETPRIQAIQVDGAVLGFAVGASLVVGLLFGLFPALQASTVDVRGALQEGSRGSSAGGGRVRDALVVGEIGLAMAILVAAGLLTSSFLRLQRVETGFAEEEILAVPLTLPAAELEGDEAMYRYLAEIEGRIGRLPGVSAVGATNVAPLSGGGTVINLSIEGRPSGPGETSFARWRAVTPGFFRAAGVRLLRGRALEPADYRTGAPEVVVVTEAFAERIFPGSDPVGKRVAMGVNATNWRTVVGMVEDVRDVGLAELPQPLFFFPQTGGWPWMTVLVRTATDPVSLAGAVRRTIREIDPTLAVPAIEPLAASKRRAVAGPRFSSLLMGGFATLSMVLAVLGIYGIMSHAVARRTREIGIRMALGARPGRVVRTVLGRGVRLIVWGIGLGAVAALGLSRFLGALLYETSPADVTTFGGIALLLGGVALLSAWIPARRAAHADPMTALRTE